MAEQRDAVRLLADGGRSLPRTCVLIGIPRSTFLDVAKPADAPELLTQIRELAARHPRYGYRRSSALLRSSRTVHETRVRRLWRQQRRQVRRVGRRRRWRAAQSSRLAAALRMLTVMDAFTRDGRALDVVRTTSAERVIAVLRTLIAQHGPPRHLHSDNGAELVAPAVQGWLEQAGVQTLYIDPGKPWQHGKEERFNGTVRDECVNLYRFHSLADAQARLDAFHTHYKHARPHSRLGYLAPLTFTRAWYEAKAKQQDP